MELLDQLFDQIALRAAQLGQVLKLLVEVALTEIEIALPVLEQFGKVLEHLGDAVEEPLLRKDPLVVLA